MNPALKKVLFGALAAVCGALATYFATGCNGALPPKAESALDQALCAKSAAESVDALKHPELLDATEALALAHALRDCFAPPAPVGDAGVTQ